ncbi:UNVERIFIED_CONTAM: hypothetical protein H355_002871 [Colinus virginianus]|nr:hypothetical protein H355_002871 [Colinus virginianus]
MELYQKDNKEVIQKNKIKLTREQKELEEALEVERQENEQRRLLEQKEEQLQQMMKRKNKQALLDELESSSLPASLLLAQHKDKSTQLETQLEKPKPVKPVTFSTGIKMPNRWAQFTQSRLGLLGFVGLDLQAAIQTKRSAWDCFFCLLVPEGQHISLSPVQKLEETLYEYQPLEVETYGPPVPELESLGRLGRGRDEELDEECVNYPLGLVWKLPYVGVAQCRFLQCTGNCASYHKKNDMFCVGKSDLSCNRRASVPSASVALSRTEPQHALLKTSDKLQKEYLSDKEQEEQSHSNDGWRVWEGKAR